MITSSDQRLRTDDDQPNIKAMQAELSTACRAANNATTNQERDENTRDCRWPDQEDDGRKPERVGGKAAEPWPGASDTRIRLADSIVIDHVTMMKAAQHRGQLSVRGTESQDSTAAGKVQIYLDYLRGIRLRAMVRREGELAAQFRQTHGYAAMAVIWRQEWAREYETVTLAQVQEIAAKEPQGPVASLLASLYYPDHEVMGQLAGMLVQMYEDLDRGEAYKQLNALKTKGEMTLPRRYLRVNEPQWEALQWWRDLFGPLNTPLDLQRAPWLAWRVTLTEAELQEKAISDGWEDDFIKAVGLTKGKSVLDELVGQRARKGWREVFQDSTEEMEGLHEVFYFYYRFSDETGVPCLYRTVMSPHVAPAAGEQDAPHGPDEPLGYDHGHYPFVPLIRERKNRTQAESRSVPAVVLTQQQEIKHMRDARINQTDLVLQPPLVRPEREVGLPIAIRPRGEIGEKRVDATHWMPVASTAAAGQPVQDEARLDADRYFARNREEDPVRAGLYDQTLADDWGEELSECWQMTLELAQQFQGDLTFSRIVGGETVPFTLSPEDIQGSFDLQLSFSVDQLDPDQLAAKAKLLQAVVMPLDRFGIIDWAPILKGIVRSLLPEYADEALRDVNQASDKEIEDEQTNWAKMITGTEPPMYEAGQNFALRLQWLQQQLQQPASQKVLAALPDSAALVEKRLQHLQFMVQQKTVNAQTGRVGVAAGPTAA